MDASMRSRFERRVRELAGYGRRSSATGGEGRAAVYSAEELAALGLEPVLSPAGDDRGASNSRRFHRVLLAVMAPGGLPLKTGTELVPGPAEKFESTDADHS